MSTSTPNALAEGKELDLVGKVELRLALADSDTKLGLLLKTYLCPLLLKLGSEHISVRNKVISICQHINTRIQPAAVGLPVTALLEQYKGFDRFPVKDRLDLLPKLMHGLVDNFQESITHTARLFNLLLRLLPQMTLPLRGSTDDHDLRVKLGLADRSQDAEFVATWLGKVILFNLTSSATEICPGLSAEDCQFLQLHGKLDVWNPASHGGLNITETKIVAARFLASGAFTEAERFLPALFASADSNSRLSDIGDDILKRAIPAISLEDHELVNRLFTTYLGSQGEAGSLPVRKPLQTKILALLCRSKEATTFVAQIAKIVKGALEPPDQGSQTVSGLPRQGLETTRLRGQVFAFTNWVARTGSLKYLNALAPALVKDLRTYIEGQGWPRMNDDNSNSHAGEVSSRSFGYESIGLLAKACPSELLVEPSLDLLRWLFISLSSDASGKDISISIEGALSSVVGAFAHNIDNEVEAALTNLLLYNMTLHVGQHDSNGNFVVRSTCYIAVRFANRCLPFSNATARWIDVLALGDGPQQRSEVVEEGKKGLDPHWYRNLNPLDNLPTTVGTISNITRYNMPKFDELVEAFFPDGRGTRSANKARVGSGFSAAIVFCRCVLLHHALASKNRAPMVDVDWERNIDAAIKNDEDIRSIARDHLERIYRDSPSVLLRFLDTAFEGFIDEGTVDADRPGACLLELCSLCPGSALDNIASRSIELRGVILGNRHDSRVIGSHVFGLLGSRGTAAASTVEDLIQVFLQKIDPWQDAIGPQVHEVHGAILATAYWLSRQKYLKDDYDFHGEAELRFMKSVLAILDASRDKELLDAAILATSQLSLFGTLSPTSIPAPHEIFFLINKLKKRAADGDEKAVYSMGYLAMQCDEDVGQTSPLTHLTEALFGLHEKRQPELQFAVGAALSCVAVGWQSKSLIGIDDVQRRSPPRSSKRSKVLGILVERILKDCNTTKPALRQGSVIWLLCIVQYCGHLPEVQSQLRNCQAAFKGFLADRESLNQETASRGLTLIYEKGDRALKDDLIRDLVGSFTGTNAGLAGNVSGETQLFEPGALPTGDGSITTYKDIMSLAAEIGDSSLVYKFMSLASNDAIWSSRAAFGRFGLSNILTDSSVDGYLAQNPKLYPVLFRYRFDPNTNVRIAMSDIWSALVKNPTSTIDTYFDSIIEDLFKNILGKEWRVRQASCVALAELVQGRPLEKYEKYLNRIWSLTFKVCDDIKDSVRKAAMALARVLTAILTRSLEAGEASKNAANSMLKEILPFLLGPSGLESSAQEVQAFSLGTLLKIIKSSNGKILRPFLPDLIGRLLGLLSSLEPQEINYLHLNADKYGVTAQQIDDVRLTSVKTSPMMEAIEKCLDMLDEASMNELQPSLVNALKTTIGLPSRVGVSRVLVSLSTRHNFIFKPYADSVLRLLRKQVLDRNDTISTSFAAALGYVARVSSPTEVLHLFEYCKKLYFDSGEDERHRAVSGEIVFAVAKYATDQFASLASDILPFVFLAKHDPIEQIKDIFKGTWNDNVGGSRAVLLYLKEILAISSPHLDSPRWSIKHTAAFAIADVVSSTATELSPSNADMIWPVLEKAMGGKTWDGKEEVLIAFVTFAKHSGLLLSNQRIGDQMQSIMVRESKRKNLQYRQHALAQLGDFVESCKLVDWFERVDDITRPVIKELLEDEHDMDIDSQSGGVSSKITSEKTLANALRTLLRSIDPTLRKDARLDTSISQVLELVKKAIARNDRVVQDAILEGEKALFTKLANADSISESLDEILTHYVPTLFPDNGTEASRARAAEAVEALAACARKEGRVDRLLRQTVSVALERERSPLVRQGLQKAEHILDRSTAG